MIVLLGSHAGLVHGLNRQPMDLDILGPYDEVVKFAKNTGLRASYPIQQGKKWVFRNDETIIEAEIAWDGSSAQRLLNLIVADPKTTEDRGRLVPSLNVLYMLKMSHRFLKNSPHFLKTMRDIQDMRRLGAVINHLAYYKEREKETYAYDHPRLNVTKGDFFTGDGVDYQYDHDSIHESMAHLEKPAYRFYQPENSQVNVSRVAFYAQPEEVRLLGVLEESYVLALERSQIPFKGMLSPKKSFDIAHKKVCTSITSGFFRDYAWEHYDDVQALYSDSYVDRFWNSVSAGTVRSYSGNGDTSDAHDG